jgi:diaminopimelate epimerase
MELSFNKYQGTGNDFILVDNRKHVFKREDTSLVKKLCDRRFGIGADGMMLLQEKEGYDFDMVYYNSDGNESSMCGNGGRCITAFAATLGLVTEHARFTAIDGEHEAILKDGIVSLKMNDVKGVEVGDDYFFLNTGSPHYVAYVNSVRDANVFAEGRKIRYNERFRDKGTNVNFIEKANGGIFVRTYERGVEDETYSCGTGVTAAVLSHALKHPVNGGCKVKTLGGELYVKFKQHSDNSFTDIWLEGPATFVFKGSVSL